LLKIASEDAPAETIGTWCCSATPIAFAVEASLDGPSSSERWSVEISFSVAFAASEGRLWSSSIWMVEGMTGVPEVDATFGIDPVLAEEIALLDHLAVGRLATGEGDDGAHVDGAASGRRRDKGLDLGTGRQNCTQRDKGADPDRRSPHDR